MELGLIRLFLTYGCFEQRKTIAFAFIPVAVRWMGEDGMEGRQADLGLESHLLRVFASVPPPAVCHPIQQQPNPKQNRHQCDL